MAAVAAAALWLAGPAKASVQELRRAVGLLPGWCATCMFALMPLPQLVRGVRVGCRSRARDACYEQSSAVCDYR
jgi:hypothetical protein